MNVFGIAAAVALLILLIYKKVSLIPASIPCVLVLCVSNGASFTELMADHYAVSLGDFIRKYFLVFVSNALFGKIMEETLLAAAFSQMIGKAFGDKNAVFGAMLATALLSYGGVSVFVIVFTVYPIFLSTFRKADLPGRLMPACIMSSSCTFPLSMLPGGAQLNNIIPSQYIGTSPMAAPVTGLICSLTAVLFLVLYFNHEFNKARRRGEHFQADETRLKQTNASCQDAGVKPWLSVLPLAFIIILINFFGVELAYAVFSGCLLALIIGWRNLKDKLGTLNRGAQLIAPAMVTTAVSVGFGGAVLGCAGARTILDFISSLPVNPVISLGLACAFAGSMTGNGGGGADVAMNLLSAQYLAMGVGPQLLHRIAAIATAGFSCLPNNGMLITIINTCGYTAKDSYKDIFISTVLCSFVSLAMAILLGCAGFEI